MKTIIIILAILSFPANLMAEGTQFIEKKTATKNIEKIGFNDNGFLKIVNVYEEDGYILAIVKIQRKLLKAGHDKAKVLIDYYDKDNRLLGGDSVYVEDYKTLAPDETQTIKFNKPADVETYQVWLPDFSK